MITLFKPCPKGKIIVSEGVRLEQLNSIFSGVQGLVDLGPTEFEVYVAKMHMYRNPLFVYALILSVYDILLFDSEGDGWRVSKFYAVSRDSRYKSKPLSLEKYLNKEVGFTATRADNPIIYTAATHLYRESDHIFTNGLEEFQFSNVGKLVAPRLSQYNEMMLMGAKAVLTMEGGKIEYAY